MDRKTASESYVLILAKETLAIYHYIWTKELNIKIGFNIYTIYENGNLIICTSL
jgi:hypothetical protein